MHVTSPFLPSALDVHWPKSCMVLEDLKPVGVHCFPALQNIVLGSDAVKGHGKQILPSHVRNLEEKDGCLSGPRTQASLFAFAFISSCYDK